MVGQRLVMLNQLVESVQLALGGRCDQGLFIHNMASLAALGAELPLSAAGYFGLLDETFILHYTLHRVLQHIRKPLPQIAEVAE